MARTVLIYDKVSTGFGVVHWAGLAASVICLASAYWFLRTPQIDTRGSVVVRSHVNSSEPLAPAQANPLQPLAPAQASSFQPLASARENPFQQANSSPPASSNSPVLQSHPSAAGTAMLPPRAALPNPALASVPHDSSAVQPLVQVSATSFEPETPAPELGLGEVPEPEMVVTNSESFEPDAAGQSGGVEHSETQPNGLYSQ